MVPKALHVSGTHGNIRFKDLSLLKPRASVPEFQKSLRCEQSLVTRPVVHVAVPCRYPNSVPYRTKEVTQMAM
jgi:hypothetical protein